MVIPLHPSTAKKMKEFDIKTSVTFLKPQSYRSFLSLLLNCDLIITDSGGVQKEAYFAEKNCITIREETEWPELIELKVNILSKPENIYKTYQKNLLMIVVLKEKYMEMVRAHKKSLYQLLIFK